MEKKGLRKKVLLVTRPICPPWDEASKNFAYTLAKSIADFDFYLLTNGLVSNLPENVHQKPIYTSSRFSYLQKIRLIKHLRKIRNDFDILHYIFTPTKQNSFLIKKLAGSKKAKTIQTIATLREDLFSEDEIKNLVFGDLIITYSKHAKDKLEKLGFKNVRQVYPGIDISLYSPAPKSIALINQIGISFDDFIVTYPGEYTRLGATDDLIKMVLDNIAAWKENGMKLILACRVKNEKDQRKKEEIEKLLKTKGLENIVLLPGTFTTMEKVYNLSDIVIFPVRDMKGKFDVPLAVIEAMACGKSVIISENPILREFANESNSVKIESGNPEKLMETILDLLKDKEKRNTLGNSARLFAEENFDIQKVAERYREIYKNL
jgi:glycosyltransferase involved in cell wall biosynthesis